MSHGPSRGMVLFMELLRKSKRKCLPYMKVLTLKGSFVSFTLTAKTRCLATMAANWEGASPAKVNANQEVGLYQ